MKAHFSFGKSGIDVAVPDSFQTQVIHSRTGDALADEPAALGAALDSPIGCAPLKELASGKKTAAISVCDITRPAPNRVTLPPVLERLHAAGIPVEDVTILIATGLHRGATEDEINSIVGPEIAAKYRIVSHDAKVLSEHRYLGETRRGTPVHIDERFIAADLHITLGFIEQHLMLGFSGGRKLVAPGLAAQETIKVAEVERDASGENPHHRILGIQGETLFYDRVGVGAQAGGIVPPDEMPPVDVQFHVQAVMPEQDHRRGGGFALKAGQRCRRLQRSGLAGRKVDFEPARRDPVRQDIAM